MAAGPLEDGLAAYGQSDFATEAFELLQPLADQGNARAQAALGLMYQNGQGVPQDHAEAQKWLRLASDQGLAAAQYFLAEIIFNGDGVPRDYAEALKWF